jgi:PAS domain S-box-containing protein
MLEHPLRIHRLLDKFFPRSYAAKFVLIAFIAIHLPLLSVAVSFAFKPALSPTAFFLDVLLATLIGCGVVLLLIPRLLAPLDVTLQVLEAHAAGEALPQVTTFSDDASGRLLKRTIEILSRLRSSEQRYTSLFHAIPDGISCFNRQGEYTEIKPPRYFSYVATNLIGKTPEDIYTPEFAAMIRGKRARMWATGEMQSYEIERTVNGQISYREVSIFLLSDSEGAALVRDISEQKQAQQRLQESEARFRSFFENSPNPCLMLDYDGAKVISSIRINQALDTFLGGVPSDVVNMKRVEVLAYIESISHPEDWQQDFAYLSEVSAGVRDSYRMEKRYLHSDGTWRWGDYSCSAIRDDEGNILRVLATIQDITARKHAERNAAAALEQLRVSEARFRAFFEDSSVPCFMVTMHDETDAGDHNVQLLVNQAFCDFLGEDADNLRKMTLADTATYNQRITHPDDFASEQALVNEVLAGSQSHYRIEKRYLRSDGQVLWGDLTNHALRDEQGHIYQFIALIQDITERKQVQNKLQNTLAQLETSETMFRTFFEGSGSAHSIIDMRDPENAHDDRLLVNQAFQTLLADTHFPNLPVKTFADIAALNEAISQPDDLVLEQQHSHALLTGDIDGYSLEKRYLKRNGDIIWTTVQHNLIRRTDGQPHLLVSTVQDISDLKHTQEHLSQTLQRLETSEAKFRAFFEGSGSAHSIINMQDPDTARPDRLLANRAYDRLMADTLVADIPVRTLADIATLNNALTHPEDLMVENEHNQALVSGQKDSYKLEKRFLKHNDEVIWVVVTHSLIRQSDGSPNLLLSTIQDITDLKRTQEHLSQTLARLEQALNTKNMLMREIHHRVKNNLQVIGSLLSLQARLLSDTSAKNALSESHKRVMAMAEIHELMHHTDAGNRIDFALYLEELIALMRRSYSLDDVAIHLELTPVTLPLDQGIPLALITNELVSNALKYAFPEGAHKQPTITIRLQRSAHNVTLCVEDNGVGLDNNNGGDSNSLGMTIVESLSGQLNGTLTFTNKHTTHNLADNAPQLAIESIPNHLYDEKTEQDTTTDATETGLQVTVRFPLPEARGMSTQS